MEDTVEVESFQPTTTTFRLPAVWGPVKVTGTVTEGDCGVALFVCTNEMLETVPTVKFAPLLGMPPTVTTTLPEEALKGTGATMLVALQLVGVATVPLKVTVLVPWEEPKFVPVMVTEVPTGPEVGFKFVMLGAAVPLAARNATICMIQDWFLSRNAVAL